MYTQRCFSAKTKKRNDANRHTHHADQHSRIQPQRHSQRNHDTQHKQAHDTHITVGHFRPEEKAEKEETERERDMRERETREQDERGERAV